MELYLQSIALALIAVILSLVLRSQNKALSLLLTLGICCLICISVVQFLNPVIELVRFLQDLSGISNQMLSILLKVAGISFLAELTGMICSDAGESALSKTVLFLSNAVVLWISLPLFEQLIALLQEVLGKL